MPLVDYSVAILRDLVRETRYAGRTQPTVLTLSTPDLVLSRETLLRICKGIPLDQSKLKVRPDSEGIINWHKAQRFTKEIIDTTAFLEAIGCTHTAVDMTGGRGNEFIHNLDEPWTDKFRLNQIGEGFDIVFDCITNQCFNVAQAMENAWQAVRVGGYIFHVTPVQMINQGFWNVSPAAYHDFYAANFGKMIRFEHVVGVYTKQDETVLEATRRVRVVLDDTMNVVVAQKMEEAPTTWPIMTKFKNHPTCIK